MKFLRILTCLAAMTGWDRSCPAESPQRPNVLFIAIDDLNDWVGCLHGHPQALTPNIDRLAQRGVLFTNAHCASPSCNPSRAAVFSGQMAWKTGVWSNHSPKLLKQHPDIPILPQQFQRAGYVTRGAGKLMHPGGEENAAVFDEPFDVEQRWSPLTAASVAYTPAELPSKGTDSPQHLVQTPGAPDVVLPLNGMPSERHAKQPGGESFDWGPLEVPDARMGDTQVADWAVQKLKAKSDKPYFLGVGFYRPHIPLWAPKTYFDRFASQPGQLPEILPSDLDDLGPTGRKWAHEADTAGLHSTVVQHRQWRQAVEAYLACTTFVDAQVGRLLDALDARADRDNTIVVLWSDHGWHLGEKEHWGKWTGWEQSTRVPLIIVPPAGDSAMEAARGQHCAEPVSLLDLFPTLTRLAGIPAPAGLDGQSLLPLLREPARKTNRIVATVFDPGNVSLRSDGERYIRYADGSEELYDLKTDPREWTNRRQAPGTGPSLERFRREVPLEALPAEDRGEWARLRGGDRKFRAKDVFDHSQPILFRTDFGTRGIDKLQISEDDRYALTSPDPERLAIVPAPQSADGAKAVRFVVPRAGTAFRSELSLPHESGFHERWYAGRIYLPEDRDDAKDAGADIVMQWHAIPGNWRATYPNLSLDVDKGHWRLRTSAGDAQNGPDRKTIDLGPVTKGQWVEWVFQVAWSPKESGRIRVWKNGEPVLDRPGPNAYSTIGVEYTPYLKFGIYHPEWKKPDTTRPAGRPARTVYLTGIVVADERADLGIVRQASSPPP